MAYFTNAEFGIENPLASKVPDLSQLDIRGDLDVGFRNPARNIGAANFGQITRTRGGPRVIQLGLKFRF